MNYERDTLNAYSTTKRAAEYKQHNTKDWTWARFVTWREQKSIARELERYNWSQSDQLLDIPCGTGILGRLLHRFPFRIVASDISKEMMALARDEYPEDRLVDCIKSDITNTPFERGSFACVITLGFLHRVPSEIKHAALQEIAALSNRVVILSCSVDTPLQRFKHAILSRIKSNHVPAPCPESMSDIIKDCESHGLRLVHSIMVVPLLSAHALFVLEKI